MYRNNWVYYEDKDFKATLEDIDGYLFIHVEVYSYNRVIKRRMAEVWADIKVWADEDDYDGIFAYTPNPKYCRAFGEYIKLTEAWVGDIKYEVLQWELK